jgi:hypothetical protein
VRDRDEVLVAHDFAYGRGHFGCNGAADASERRGCDRGVPGGDVEQPVAQFTYGQMRDALERHSVMAVDDQAGDFVVLVWNHHLFEEYRQRRVGQCLLGGGAFCVGVCGAAGQLIAGPQRRGLGHHLDQAVEGVRHTAGTDGALRESLAWHPARLGR